MNPNSFVSLACCDAQFLAALFKLAKVSEKVSLLAMVGQLSKVSPKVLHLSEVALPREPNLL